MITKSTICNAWLLVNVIIFGVASIGASQSDAWARDPGCPPNVVLILADDLGRHQLGCYGSSFYETPNIDRLATDGLLFTSAYSAATVCSPTRASILTGKYPARLHLTDYIPGRSPDNTRLLTPRWQQSLPLEEVTIAECLQKAGYVTGHFGKWHLNTNKQYRPGRPGDPGSQGFEDVLTTHKPNAGPASKYADDWHHVREITERALAFIELNREQPFLCYVSHNSIHAPEIENPKLVQKYAQKKDAENKGRKNPKQGAMLETLDQSVGQLVRKIESLGLENDTIVIFFSDNGQLGPKDGSPLRGSKGDLYEGGIRMPLVVQWPGVIEPGGVCHEIVISNDFFSTLNEIAGGACTSHQVDGVSLLDLFRDPAAKLNRQSVFWHYPHYHSQGLGPQGAMRRGRFKLIEWFEKSAYGEDGAFELYDLVADSAEQENLVNRMPNLVVEMSKELRDWRARLGAQSMEKND